MTIKTIKKFVSYLIVFVFVLAASTFITSKIEAAVEFPAGCSSSWGVSVTTGDPCNGESTPTTSIPGCSTPLGVSTTTGENCSGADEPISYLAGCTSIYGYSFITMQPCNGTATASVYTYTGPGTPGLPVTGVSGLLIGDKLLLTLLGILTVIGIVYTMKPRKAY